MTPDDLILTWIHVGWSSHIADILFAWLSDKFTFSLPLMLALLIYASAKQAWRGVAWWFGLILVIAIGDLCGNQLKHLFSELRPCCPSAAFELLRADFACRDTYLGMPSNHAINFFSATLFVMMTRPAWRHWHVVLLCAAILASISRIYLAKHYPSQVVAGAFIGMDIGILSGLFVRYRIGIVNMLTSLKISNWQER
jgi:undecaprenyl-diphosphatase